MNFHQIFWIIWELSATHYANNSGDITGSFRGGEQKI